MTATRRNSNVAKSNDQEGSGSDHELLTDIHQGDEDAEQQLIGRYQGVVAAVADSYEGSGLDCEALKLEGEKGLKLAIKKLRPISSFEFSSSRVTRYNLLDRSLRTKSVDRSNI
jgi:DNA-directed RNA polymerase sigma subunit (sigma70/sigma32)